MASAEGVVHTSTSMSFLSVAPPSPTIFRQLYLFALRRKSWNWANWELPNEPFILHSDKDVETRQKNRCAVTGVRQVGQFPLTLLTAAAV